MMSKIELLVWKTNVKVGRWVGSLNFPVGLVIFALITARHLECNVTASGIESRPRVVTKTNMATAIKEQTS